MGRDGNRVSLKTNVFWKWPSTDLEGRWLEKIRVYTHAKLDAPAVVAAVWYVALFCFSCKSWRNVLTPGVFKMTWSAALHLLEDLTACHRTDVLNYIFMSAVLVGGGSSFMNICIRLEAPASFLYFRFFLGDLRCFCPAPYSSWRFRGQHGNAGGRLIVVSPVSFCEPNSTNYDKASRTGGCFFLFFFRITGSGLSS